MSIVITSHNHQAYVGEAIDSALAQTHPDVEVIAVDDGSTDDSAAVLAGYEPNGVRVVLQENRGQAGAINAGYALATGELVIFLDGDDVVLPTAAAAAVATFEERVAQVQWPLAEIDARGKATGETTPVATLSHGDLLEQLLQAGPLQWASSGLGAAWARRYLELVMPVPEPDFWYAADAYLVALAPLYGQVRALEQPHTLYRRHASNHSGRPFDEMISFDTEIARKLFALTTNRARALGLEVDPARWERTNWSLMAARSLAEIDAVVERTVPFVLIDGMQLSLEPGSGRRVIPFLEHEGQYWGEPEDDAHGDRRARATTRGRCPLPRPRLAVLLVARRLPTVHRVPAQLVRLRYSQRTRSHLRAGAMKLWLGLLVGLVLVARPSWAAAEISGAGPDETASQAYGPLQGGVEYSGAFVGPSDVDYLSFVVAQAGETLQFTVQNTTQVCQDPYDAGCPVYATLMDSTGQNQVGGDNSDAGTIATAGDTETFAWTFAQPGTYYVLMESDGDLPAGSPSYSLEPAGGAGTGSSSGSGRSPGPGGSGAGNTGSPLVRSLKVLPHQRGSAVVVTLDLGRATPWIRVALFLAHGRDRARPIMSRTLHRLRAGRHRLVLRLQPADRSKLAHGQRLSLILRITLGMASRPAKRYTRTVTVVD